MADRTLDIQIKANNLASKELAKVKDDIKNITDETKKATTGLSKFNDGIKNNSASFKKMAAVGTAAFIGVSASIKKFVSDASSFESVNKSFNRLTEGIGISANEVLSSMKKASKGTINDTSLILSANRAMSLGVAKNTEDFTTLMEIASVKGKAMGLTTEKAFEDIVTGLGRGSPLILDNLGIVINATEANEEYAKSIGKTASELTDAEKKQAIINKVVADGKKELESIGDSALTASEKKEKLYATISNLSIQIGETLIPIINSAIDTITPLVEKIKNFAEENPKLTATIAKVVFVVTGLIAAIGFLGLAIPPIVAGLALINIPILAIIAAGVLLMMHWDTITEFLGKVVAGWIIIFEDLWADIKEKFLQGGEFIYGAIEGWKMIFEDVKNSIVGAGQAMYEGFIGWVDTMKDAMFEKVTAIVDFVKNKVDAMKNTLASIGGGIMDAGAAVGGAVSGAFQSVTGSRAVGGSVVGGNAYMVGERGPELFIPQGSGTIKTDAQPQVNINMGGVSVTNEADENRLVEKIKRELSNTARLQSIGVT